MTTSSSPSSSQLLLLSLSIGLLIIIRSLKGKKSWTFPWKKLKDQETKSSTEESSGTSYECYPPLPQEVVKLLRASRLCFLATQSDGEPHLSLMNFTYYREEEILILSTRRNTKKFEQILESPKVAVLIHDFPNIEIPVPAVAENHGKSWSITLNGLCKVVDEESELCTRLRSIHLANNPDYSQFITAEGSAILCVYIDKARMCDVHDRVSYWCSKSGLSAHADHSSIVSAM